MSIEINYKTPAALPEQPVVGKTSPDKQGASFQQVMSSDSVAEPPVELTALQMLFRCPPGFTKPPSTVLEPDKATLATESGLPTVANPVAPRHTCGCDLEPKPGIPAPPQEALDPSPAAPWPTTVIRPFPTPELAEQAKSAVLGALEKEGMDSAGVKISYWEELVGYPGGSYTNKNITIQTASGRKIDLDAAYMARAPWLAASAVQDLDKLLT